MGEGRGEGSSLSNLNSPIQNAASSFAPPPSPRFARPPTFVPTEAYGGGGSQAKAGPIGPLRPIPSYSPAFHPCQIPPLCCYHLMQTAQLTRVTQPRPRIEGQQ